MGVPGGCPVIDVRVVRVTSTLTAPPESGQVNLSVAGPFRAVSWDGWPKSAVARYQSLWTFCESPPRCMGEGGRGKGKGAIMTAYKRMAQE